MPIRNPFARRNGPVAADDTLHPQHVAQQPPRSDAPGFERVDTVGSKAPSVMTIGSSKSHDPGEYKMSVVNDSGVYLPPSPTQEKAQWPRKYLGRTSTDTRSSCDMEPFSISRESFDSYRRSFDISARSPVTHDFPARASLDSARLPRSASRRMPPTSATVEEDFEEVGLDEPKPQPQPRKRGFFAKFADAGHDNANSTSGAVGSSGIPSSSSNQGPVSRLLMTGRKRGQSGQGAELGNLDHPAKNTADERND